MDYINLLLNILAVLSVIVAVILFASIRHISNNNAIKPKDKDCHCDCDKNDTENNR